MIILKILQAHSFLAQFGFFFGKLTGINYLYEN